MESRDHEDSTGLELMSVFLGWSEEGYCLKLPKQTLNPDPRGNYGEVIWKFCIQFYLETSMYLISYVCETFAAEQMSKKNSSLEAN